jgi:hypothetical protein
MVRRARDAPVSGTIHEAVEERWRRPMFCEAPKSLLRKAGFTRIEASASCEWFATREAIEQRAEITKGALSGISEELIALDWSTSDEIDGMMEAITEWGNNPDAFLMIPFFEAVGWKE